MTRNLTLGIDTAAGIGVGLAGPDGISTRTVSDTRVHVEQLTPTIAALLSDGAATWSDIARIGVGVGPGPFTGLRVGIVTAQALGFALGVPVTGVCSLDVVARDVVGAGTDIPDEFVVALDARRKELYWARYDAAGARRGEPVVSAPRDLPALPVTGPGALLYPDVLRGRLMSFSPATVDAGLLAAHLDDLADAGLEPLYLRKPDAESPGTRKSVLAAGTRLPETVVP